MSVTDECDTEWLRLVGSIKLYVSFAKEPIMSVTDECDTGWLRLVGSIRL